MSLQSPILVPILGRLRRLPRPHHVVLRVQSPSILRAVLPVVLLPVLVLRVLRDLRRPNRVVLRALLPDPSLIGHLLVLLHLDRAVHCARSPSVPYLRLAILLFVLHANLLAIVLHRGTAQPVLGSRFLPLIHKLMAWRHLSLVWLFAHRAILLRMIIMLLPFQAAPLPFRASLPNIAHVSSRPRACLTQI